MKGSQLELDGRAELSSRRRFIREAAIGSTIVVLGGLYGFANSARGDAAERRPDGRPRLPPGQRLLTALKPMGGQPGSPLRKDFRLRLSGEVEQPQELDFEQMSKLGKSELSVDVHCVTGWSVLGARFAGVPIQALARLAKPKPSARHVIFEAAHGYTANVLLQEALGPQCLVAFELDGVPLPQQHGSPVRAVVPDLYFWKSPKWLTGIRFSDHDEPGYWERRGYNNHADPWREERYA
ncbi:MAG TPA: molybdopterin-dependent oxidoreductase [Polyangiaceae bacterium]|nr:molybdopterin-dependent oxidoreductase [Polyangiaceae bacterium]